MTISKTLYDDIAKRTHGDIYIGVVGPVRVGKSTFIKRFMDTLVIPHIDSAYMKERTSDELPQSASGRTVMTTEPKFVPGDGVELSLDNSARFRMKMIDCVGYVIPEALGLTEDGETRMVKTPWSDEAMPFEAAAEIGTRKVIREHATVAFLVTTDGSIGDIPRENYVEAEKRVAEELKEAGKPFVMVLNSAFPMSDAAQSLAAELEKTYGVPVALVNCLSLGKDDITNMLMLVLSQFPLNEVKFVLPRWFSGIEKDHPLRKRLTDALTDAAARLSKIGDADEALAEALNGAVDADVSLRNTDYATGDVTFDADIPDEVFYELLSDRTGFEIGSEDELFSLLTKYAEMKKTFGKYEDALRQVEETGYGIVTPRVEDMELKEPEIVRQAGSYGVRLKASAPSIHLIKADIETEVCPIVGSEKQSEDVVKYLLSGFEENPASIWESNMFGTSLHDLMNEGLNAKLQHMPMDARVKLTDTLQKIINEGSNGLICILL